MQTQETGHITGTPDKDYNIIWFTEACLSNALRLETYVGDAERAGDTELAEFFRRAQGESRKGAEQGKQLLASRLAVPGRRTPRALSRAGSRNADVDLSTFFRPRDRGVYGNSVGHFPSEVQGP